MNFISSKNAFIVLGLTVFLSACSAPRTQVQATPSKTVAVEITEEQKERAIQIISEDLKDSESARFQNLYGAKKEGESEILICGEVNAKNSYGGYTGYKKFYVEQSGKSRIAGSGMSNALRGASELIVSGYCEID